jgi:hypothetical protein
MRILIFGLSWIFISGKSGKNQSQLRPKTQIFIKRAEMTVISLSTLWWSEILSNRGDYFFLQFSKSLKLRNRAEPPLKSNTIFLVRNPNAQFIC